ncbi:hypothetical protein NP493_369g06009 [Ridgeia piscesae]|uniref:Uncharacterized protein n=1 Tax=Ridgeia piscesae TaxID=27915 RepID=A0AAD9NV95_RIDPI|nr:hypothetical protein NP493_369g06009 [Ridgeia piscesae]
MLGKGSYPFSSFF